MNNRPGNKTDDDKQQQPPAARNSLVRLPIQTRRITSLTAETRVNQIQANTIHNYTANWVRIQSRYNCDCGRQIGYTFQQPIVGNTPFLIDEDVITIKSTPPASEGSAFVIDDSTDSSAELLVEREEFRGLETDRKIDEEVSNISEPSSSVANTELSKSSDEPMC